MKTILYNSLERITSLYRYYEIQEASIKDIVKKGSKQNYLGYSIDRYFRLLVNGKNVELPQYEKLNTYVKDHIEIFEVYQKENSVRFRYKNPEALKKEGIELDVRTASSEFQHYCEMPLTLRENTLVMLITRFEEFISKMISFIYEKHPQKYLDSQKISFSEIVNCGVDEVRNKIISREVDNMMRQSNKEWFKLFESQGMNLNGCKSELDAFKEINARRNIIVHNMGRVNSIYLQQVPSSKVELNSYIETTESYIKEVFSVVKTLIFIIYIEAIRMADMCDRAKLIEYSFTIAFDELCKENYSLCKTVYLSLSENKFADAQYKYMSKVNYWISMIELGHMNKVVDEIRQFDVSALDVKFVIAKNLLLEEYDEAVELIESQWKKTVFQKMIEEWPIYRKFRETPQYEAFIERHSEDYSVTMIEVEDAENAATEDICAEQLQFEDNQMKESVTVS